MYVKNKKTKKKNKKRLKHFTKHVDGCILKKEKRTDDTKSKPRKVDHIYAEEV